MVSKLVRKWKIIGVHCQAVGLPALSNGRQQYLRQQRQSAGTQMKVAKLLVKQHPVMHGPVYSRLIVARRTSKRMSCRTQADMRLNATCCVRQVSKCTLHESSMCRCEEPALLMLAAQSSTRMPRLCLRPWQWLQCSRSNSISMQHLSCVPP